MVVASEPEVGSVTTPWEGRDACGRAAVLGSGREHGSVEASLEQAMRGVPGLVTYTLVRTQEGGVSVTVCQDEAATEKSVQVARDWIRQNLTASANPPEVSEGDVILQLT